LPYKFNLKFYFLECRKLQVSKKRTAKLVILYQKTRIKMLLIKEIMK